MLSPFKAFLNNLQKNASASILGLSRNEDDPATEADLVDNNIMDPNANRTDAVSDAERPITNGTEPKGHLEQCIIASVGTGEHAATLDFQLADEQLSQQSGYDEDPLSDPLALEDCLQFVDATMPVAAPPAAATSAAAANASEITLVDVSLLTSTTANGSATATASDEQCTEEGVRSEDGSDSGLGQESANSNSTTGEASPKRPAVVVLGCQPPLRTALKRRSDVTDTFNDLDASGISSASNSSTCSKRPKRHIHFNDVNVYYFQRQQGFMCVPSQGGCSLGMAATHSYQRRFTLAEYAAEQRRIQRHKAQELKRGTGLAATSSDESAGGSEDECKGSAHRMNGGGTTGPSGAGAAPSGGIGAAGADPAAAISSDSDDNDSPGIQPVSARQRRIMLKAAGVRRIDAAEKKECREILVSRDNCGCNCRGFCDPETCACAQSGIKCQVDRLHYPCGCTRDGCGNPVGRAEFNKARVKTHYIHTFLRLQLESKPMTPPQAATATVQPQQQLHHSVHLHQQSHPVASTNGGSIGSNGGWHSQVGRSLAAMSGDNLYNMNGASTTTTIASPHPTTAGTPSDLLPTHLQLQLDQTPDLHYAYDDDNNVMGYNAPLTTGPTHQHHHHHHHHPHHHGAIGDCFDGIATSSASAATLAASSCSGANGSGSGSGLNTPTNICGSPSAHAQHHHQSAFAAVLSAAAASAASALYSPDSASIVEPTPQQQQQPQQQQLLVDAATTNNRNDEDYYPHNHEHNQHNLPRYHASEVSMRPLVPAPFYPQTPASTTTSAAPTPSNALPSMYSTDFGGTAVTGYQHSYLYSLQRQQPTAPLPRPPLSSYSAADSHPTNNSNSSSFQHSYLYALSQQPAASASGQDDGGVEHDSTDELELIGTETEKCDENANNGVGPGADGVAADCDNGLNAFDELLDETPPEPHQNQKDCGVGLLDAIDFESELGLATTFIDKSLKTCVPPPADVAAAVIGQPTRFAHKNGSTTGDDEGTGFK